MGLFQSKRKKIEAYLKQKANDMTAFDGLLQDHLSGRLTERLSSLGLAKMEVHIDWLPDYQCIGVQGQYREFFVDVQIEPTQFTFAIDQDEPEEYSEYPLSDTEGFYHEIAGLLAKHAG